MLEIACMDAGTRPYDGQVSGSDLCAFEQLEAAGRIRFVRLYEDWSYPVATEAGREALRIDTMLRTVLA